MKAIITFYLFIFLGTSMPKNYIHTYYKSGKRMSSGWLQANKKTDYWFFYYENESKKSEGHFKNNKKEGFWKFYNISGKTTKQGHFKNGIPINWWRFYINDIEEKCLYQQDGITRYCLVYEHKKLIKGTKYINDTFVKEWNSIIKFKKDNPNFSF